MYGGGQNSQYPQQGGQPQGYPGQQQQQFPPGQQPYGQPQGYPGQQSQQHAQGQQGYPGQHQQQYPQGQQQYGQPQQYPGQGGQQQYPPQGGHQQQYPQGQQSGYGGHQPGYGGQSQPIIGQQYCLPHEQVFFLSEALLSVSGDDFKISDANNPAHYYDLKSSAMSMKGSRVLKDSGGNIVLNMKHKLMSGKLWYINRGANEKDVICEVKKPSGSSQGRQNVEIFLKGNTSHHFSTPRPDFFAAGDVKGKTFTILRGQQPMAEVSRKLPEESSKQRITGKDFYALRVFPGADAAFCIAIVLVMDELYND